MSESSNFSKNLIDETIKCFKEEDSLDLSYEQASEYLRSMAGLFLAFAKSADPVCEAPGGASPDVSCRSLGVGRLDIPS